MPRPDPNLPQLQAIAEALGELREQVVFSAAPPQDCC